MNFIFTEEQIQFKDTIKSFLAEECTPPSIRDGWEKNKSFNFERWKNLIELGVLNSNLPEAKGKEEASRRVATSHHTWDECSWASGPD